MACGNAVVASDVGDTRMLVNDENGILVPLEHGEIVNAIEKLINDKALAVKMGKAGSRAVRSRHNIENYTDYFLGLVQKAYVKNFSAVRQP